VSNELQDLFYVGKYREVLAVVGDKLPSRWTSSTEKQTVLQIGCLVFLGSVNEAKILFEAALDHKPTVAFTFQARFYLGIGFVRRSQYDLAAKSFAQNLWLRRSLLRKPRKSKEKSEQIELSFYAYQGAAFYHFFKGDFERASMLANKAYENAFKISFNYAEVLALDLLGHSLCHLGQIRRGLYELGRAYELSKKVGHGGIETALKITQVKFRAQFGINIKESLSELQMALMELDPEDTYSKAELYLELSKQLLLRGRGAAAQKILDEAGDIIYKHQNKRQSAIYNHRYAHLLLSRGQPHAALTLVRSLRSNLDSRVDRLILRQVDGLEFKIQKHLNMESSSLLLAGKPANFLDARMTSRALGKPILKRSVCEDPLGDLIDRVQTEKISVFNEVKELGLWGLIPQIIGVPSGDQVIYLGPGRSEVVLVSGGTVLCVEQGFTSPMKSLIRLLQGSEFKDKQFLVESTWKYQYRGEDHDRLLHATIGKIRNLFQNLSVWIEWTHQGYRLAPRVKVLGVAISPVASTRALDSVASFDVKGQLRRESPAIMIDESFNHRQAKALKLIEKGHYLGVSGYAQQFGVCTMTACRDLTSLLKSGQVVRLGKGRATRYGRLEEK
jgi:tetratricopeptide (TPR) repeat protein